MIVYRMTQPRSFTSLHRAGWSARPKLRSLKRNKRDVAQRARRAMYDYGFHSRNVRRRREISRTCCFPCNCNHGFSRSRCPQYARSRGPGTLRRAPQYLQLDSGEGRHPSTILARTRLSGRSVPWLGASRPSVDLGQRQRSFVAHAMSAALKRLPSPFSSASAKRSPPCIRGSVFRSSQRLLPGLLLAPCWGLQVSLSTQRQPRRSCTASTLNIRPVALPGQASC